MVKLCLKKKAEIFKNLKEAYTAKRLTLKYIFVLFLLRILGDSDLTFNFSFFNFCLKTVNGLIF